MGRFAGQCAGFAAVQAAILTLVVGASGLYDMDRAPFAALVDKHVALASTESEGARVIVAGDSSAAFGWRSDRVAEVCGRPVINLALHVGLGLSFILDEALSTVRRGDLVVLNLGYQHFEQSLSRGMILTLAVAHRPAAVAHLDLEGARRMLDEAHVLVGSASRALLTRVGGGPPAYVAPYRRFDFTPEGDVDTTRGAPVASPDLAMTPLRRPPGRLAETIEQLRAFVADADSRGATVALAFPPLVDRLLEANRDAIASIHAALAAIPRLALLGEPDDEALPAADFYDTFYHLRAEAAARRSERLAIPIRDLVGGS